MAASYWACNSGNGEMIAIWCGANDGWLTNLSVPVTADVSTMAALSSTRRCYTQADWLGREIRPSGLAPPPARCSSRVDTSTQASVETARAAEVVVLTSNGVTYLVPV